MITLTQMSVAEICILIGIAVVFTMILIVMIVKKFGKKKPKKDDDEEKIEL